MEERVNWVERALHSEIAFSRALGGEVTEYDDFIHIHNKAVPWGGDFNRAVGVRLSDPQSFDRIERRVEDIHREKGLDQPDRYDVLPPPLDETVWGNFLAKRGHRLWTVIFFCSPSSDKDLAPEFSLYSPAEAEYIDWYHHQLQSREYYDEEWFQTLKPLQRRFVRIFRPYWLQRDGHLVGSVYCASLGQYCRLFDVEISEEFRGRGLGIVLLDAIKIEARKQSIEHVLLQTSERLRGFYERAGFEQCTRNSVIRRASLPRAHNEVGGASAD